MVKQDYTQQDKNRVSNYSTGVEQIDEYDENGRPINGMGIQDYTE